MQGANATVVTALDEIMWLFNIRGVPADIDYNPVIMCATINDTENDKRLACCAVMNQAKPVLNLTRLNRLRGSNTLCWRCGPGCVGWAPLECAGATLW